ncbi:LOW QUALITY PROTEIN: basic phospholipase A2 sphenotoxin subunit B-like [Melanerpes formicivorus]|uniref:LOW QUALITY PROTEIN: basic phospholipase A2 sphenotoxin subunit B-like n=1 Tax=Melanerpes formicivorus TaxID=211600 RepID=UPI00358F627F
MPAWPPADGGVLQLYKMIKKATGKNALLHYSSYGCYCGLGGRGTPLDATDRCCQLHDQCYSSLCRWYHCNAMAQTYSFSWLGGHPTCNEESWCSHHSCECDLSLALCLKGTSRSYKWRHLFHNRNKCY